MVLNHGSIKWCAELDNIMALQTYATYAECQFERNRIGYETAAAYPYDDRDFGIASQVSRNYSV